MNLRRPPTFFVAEVLDNCRVSDSTTDPTQSSGALSSSSPGWGPLVFGLSASVNRSTYLTTGMVLMALKYAFEAGLIYAVAGVLWTPLEFVSPLLITRTEVVPSGDSWLLLVLALTSLPFLWVGLSMSIRRAQDAGLPAGIGLLFVFPGLNYLMMLALSILPSQPRLTPTKNQRIGESVLKSALTGTALAVGLSTAMVLFSVYALRDYGNTLFAATPAVIGAVSSWLFNRRGRQSAVATLGVAGLSIVIAGGTILLLAFEGIICLAMAAPLALIMAGVAALVARSLASGTAGSPPDARQLAILPLVALLPISATLETMYGSGERGAVQESLREVRTSIIVDAPPIEVWPNVVGFADLEPPHELIFRAGIAYPLRARIKGRGVGAVRYCEFSTGAFVEPITRWAPPTSDTDHGRLSFDVSAQPAPMHELSPYRSLHPPHLDGFLRSRKGEFRLVSLGDGRTRLEGSTWYAIDIYPSLYWAIWSDALIHAIHERVLLHIKRLTEGAVEATAAAGASTE